jgi:hypothetical protein
MGKAKKRKASKAAAAVAMEAAPRVRTAPPKPALTEEQLPARAQRAARERELAAKALRQFDVGALAFLERRAGAGVTPLEEGPGEALRDGYATSLRMGTRGRVAKRCAEPDCQALAVPGRHGCDEHSTPEDEVTEDLPPPPQSDPVGELVVADWAEANVVPAEVARCYDELVEGARLIRRAARRLERLHRNPKTGRASTSDPCRACGKTVSGLGEDRLRSGYCPADYQAWVRRGRPDRRAFELERREAS